MKNILSDFVSIHETPTYRLLKYDEFPRVQALKPGKPIEAVPLQFQKVEPKQIGHIINMSKIWGDIEKVNILWHMYRVGIHVADREFYTIINSMIKNAGIKLEYEGSQIESEYIEEITKKFNILGIFPYHLITKINLLKNLLQKGIMRGWWVISKDEVPDSERIVGFQGKINWLKVYNASFIQNKAVIYDRDHIQVVNTPLKVSYDDPDSPTYVIADLNCSSGPIIDDAVATLSLI